MPFTMKNFVFWSGVYNAGLALTLTFPPVYRLLGLIAVLLGLGDWLSGWYICSVFPGNWAHPIRQRQCCTTVRQRTTNLKE